MNSLDLLFRPRAVAVIGASRDRRSVGGAILHNLLSFEFQGQVFPVNPKASVVHSLKCYASVEDIPDPVDMAVIAVPKPHVLGVLEACGRKGVGAVVMITAGFKETGEAGLALEREVVRIIKQYGIRLVGPNCMGIINMAPDVRLQASFSANEPMSGPVAFSSQSGALGEAILALLRERGLGLSMFVSLGNKADVSGNDLLEYWEEDPQTGLILMYLESFGNPQRFLEICQRVARTKPIIAVKSGRTAAGARAAASHTGSLAGADNAVEALFQQSGVIRATSIEELFVFASAFASQPPPRGTRVAIVTNSGGPAILATDACIELGLEIPTLSAETQQIIRAAVAPEASVTNPVDMIATATAPQYEVAMRAAADDPAIDAIIAIFTSLEMIDGPSVAQGIVRGARRLRQARAGVLHGQRPVARGHRPDARSRTGRLHLPRGRGPGAGGDGALQPLAGPPHRRAADLHRHRLLGHRGARGRGAVARPDAAHPGRGANAVCPRRHPGAAVARGHHAGGSAGRGRRTGQPAGGQGQLGGHRPQIGDGRRAGGTRLPHRGWAGVRRDDWGGPPGRPGGDRGGAAAGHRRHRGHPRRHARSEVRPVAHVRAGRHLRRGHEGRGVPCPPALRSGCP
jgi:acetyl coenzyme A synthetase (ADP forming)-like protein